MNIQSKLRFCVIACVVSGLIVGNVLPAQDPVSLTGQQGQLSFTVPMALIKLSPYLCEAAQGSQPIVLPQVNDEQLQLVCERLGHVHGGELLEWHGLSNQLWKAIWAYYKDRELSDMHWELGVAYNLKVAQWLHTLTGYAAIRLQAMPFALESQAGIFQWLTKRVHHQEFLAELNPGIHNFVKPLDSEIERAIAHSIVPYTVVGKLDAQDTVENIAASPDGTKIGVTFANNTQQIFEEGKPGHYVVAGSSEHGPDSEVIEMIFYGQSIFSGVDGGVERWQRQEDGTYKVCQRLEDDGYIEKAILGVDGERIVTRGSDYRSIRVWQSQESGNCKPVLNFTWPEDSFPHSHFVFSADGRRFVAADSGVLRVWEQDIHGDYQIVSTISCKGDFGINFVRFSTDGAWIEVNTGGGIYTEQSKSRYLQQQDTGEYQFVDALPGSVAWLDTTNDYLVSFKDDDNTQVYIARKNNDGSYTSSVLQHGSKVTDYDHSLNGEKAFTLEDNQVTIWQRADDKQFDTLLKALDYYHKNQGKK